MLVSFNFPDAILAFVSVLKKNVKIKYIVTAKGCLLLLRCYPSPGSVISPQYALITTVIQYFRSRNMFTAQHLLIS